MQKNNQRIDDLGLDGLKIVQNVDGYGFTSDSVLLANFVKTKRQDLCVEIGAGSGVISILVAHKEKPQKIIAFEIQKKVAELANQNVLLNGMEKQIQIANNKIQNFKQYVDVGSVDVVFSNPPYFKFDKKVCGENDERVISRFDKELSISDLFATASKMLKFGGKMFFVHSAERVAECFDAMQENNIAPKRIYFVHPNQRKNASVFLCEGVKGGKSSVIVMPPLFTNDLDGNYIQTIQKLYKK